MTPRRRVLPWSATLVLLLAPLAGAGEPVPAGAGRAQAEDRLAVLDRRDAGAAYRLALDLEAQGFPDLATKAYEIVIGLDPEHLAARRALGYERHAGRWLQGDDARRAKGFVRHQGRWMTAEEFAAATRPEREAAEQQAGEARVRAELARIATGDPDLVPAAQRALAAIPTRFHLAPLAQALRCQPASLRVFAAGALARLNDPLAIPPLLKRVIDDPDPAVRAAVGAALRALDEPSTLAPLARALSSSYADTRVRAAEAIAMLGDVAGLGYVIARWEARSGNFPQVYFAQMRQISYIQDFDVEVAQTSFIADPIVGVLQEGVVQAVRIVATEQTFTTVERTGYHDAAKGLAGVDLGGDVKAWTSFWNQNKDRLLAERAAGYEARRRARAEAGAEPGPGR